MGHSSPVAIYLHVQFSSFASTKAGDLAGRDSLALFGGSVNGGIGTSRSLDTQVWIARQEVKDGIQILVDDRM